MYKYFEKWKKNRWILCHIQSIQTSIITSQDHQSKSSRICQNIFTNCWAIMTLTPLILRSKNVSNINHKLFTRSPKKEFTHICQNISTNRRAIMALTPLILRSKRRYTQDVYKSSPRDLERNQSLSTDPAIEMICSICPSAYHYTS